MTTPTKLAWTQGDIGFHIDSSVGLDHVMVKLLSMMQDTATCGSHLTWPKDLADILETGNPDELSDDHSELDEALEYLQEHTAERLAWYFDAYAGGLLLGPIEDEESEAS